MRVSREPEARWKPIIRIAEDQKYVDLGILLENKTGAALTYYPSLMKRRDSDDQEYGHWNSVASRTASASAAT